VLVALLSVLLAFSSFNIGQSNPLTQEAEPYRGADYAVADYAEETNAASLTTGLLEPIRLVETESYVRLEAWVFTVEFYKGSSGYNKIYSNNGSVIVHDDRIVLQYLSKEPDTWKQRGTPTGVSWTKVSDYHYNVTRFYDDYLGTTYNITYTVKANSAMKISVSLRSGQTSEYRIYWCPSGITREQWAQEENRVKFSEGADWIAFDWLDVYQSFGNITTVNIEAAADGKKANICFNIGTVSQGQSLMVDPSVVSAIASSDPFGNRVSFTDGSNRFLFYTKTGGNVVYRASSDGENWTLETTVFSDCKHVSVAKKDSHVYSVAADPLTAIYFRHGTISGLSISWDANVTMASGQYSYPDVTVDSDGYPYVIWNDRSIDNRRAQGKRASAVDGSSWGSLEYPFSGNDIYYDRVGVVALSSGGRLVAFGEQRVYDNLCYRFNNGSDWEGDIRGTKVSDNCYNFSVCVDGNDNVHFVWLNQSVCERVWENSSETLQSQTTVSNLNTASTDDISVSVNKTSGALP